MFAPRTHWECLFESIPMYTNNIILLKLRKTTLKITFTKHRVHCLLPFLNIPNCQPVLKYLSLYHKLFIFTRQLYPQIRSHELPISLPGSCVVVNQIHLTIIFKNYPSSFLKQTLLRMPVVVLFSFFKI